MFVYEKGKLYVQCGDKVVGVEIYSDKFIKVEGTEKELGKEFELLTLDEVRLRFGSDYRFQVEVTIKENKEVNGEIKDESTVNVKKSTRGRRANRS